MEVGEGQGIALPEEASLDGRGGESPETEGTALDIEGEVGGTGLTGVDGAIGYDTGRGIEAIGGEALGEAGADGGGDHRGVDGIGGGMDLHPIGVEGVPDGRSLEVMGFANQVHLGGGEGSVGIEHDGVQAIEVLITKPELSGMDGALDGLVMAFAPGAPNRDVGLDGLGEGEQVEDCGAVGAEDGFEDGREDLAAGIDAVEFGELVIMDGDILAAFGSFGAEVGEDPPGAIEGGGGSGVGEGDGFEATGADLEPALKSKRREHVVAPVGLGIIPVGEGDLGGAYDVGGGLPLVALEAGPAGGGEEGIDGVEVEGGPSGGGEQAGGHLEMELGIESALVEGSLKTVEMGHRGFPGGGEVEVVDGEIRGSELGALEFEVEDVGPEDGPETGVVGEGGREGVGVGGELKFEGAEGSERSFGGFGGGDDLKELRGDGSEVMEEVDLEVELVHFDLGGGGGGP